MKCYRPYVQKDLYIKDRTELFEKEPEHIIQFIEARGGFIRNQLYQLD